MGFAFRMRLAQLVGSTPPGYASLAEPLYGFAVKRGRKFFTY